MRKKNLLMVLISVVFFLCILGITETIQAKDLTSLTPLVGKFGIFNEGSAITTPDGTIYEENVLHIDASLNPSATYNLNKEYFNLSGKVVLSTYTGSDKDICIKFYGDGICLETIEHISHENYGQEFNINVENVSKLEIVASNAGVYGNGFCYIVNGKLDQGSLQLSESKLILDVKDSVYLAADYYKKGVLVPVSKKWKSSNSKVAKVGSKGQVYAVSSGKCTITCTAQGVTKKVSVVVKPGKVKKLQKLSVGKNYIQLKWKAISGVSFYQVFMYDTDLSEYVKMKRGKMNVVRIKGLKRNTTYKFKVCAYVKSGSKNYAGDFSKVLKVKTQK